MKRSQAVACAGVVIALAGCNKRYQDHELTATRAELRELNRRIAALEASSPQHDVLQPISVPTPVTAKGGNQVAVEQEANFSASLQDMRVTEANTVRVRYEWNYHIENKSPARRGFFGWVVFRDKAGNRIAQADISILRPLRVLGSSSETYVAFMYLQPAYANLIRTAELTLTSIPVNNEEVSYSREVEWHGAWPQ